jgi:hypothetical protein
VLLLLMLFFQVLLRCDTLRVVVVVIVACVALRCRACVALLCRALPRDGINFPFFIFRIGAREFCYFGMSQ